MKKVLILLSAAIIVSCVNDKKKDEEKRENENLFPTDTIYLNQEYKPSIDYRDENHDKFTEELNRDNKLRWIISYYTLDTIPYAESKIYEMRKDSVLAYNPHKINLKEIELKKTGTFFISGIIHDNIVLDTVWINGKKNTEVSESVFWRKIIVIDK